MLFVFYCTVEFFVVLVFVFFVVVILFIWLVLGEGDLEKGHTQKLKTHPHSLFIITHGRRNERELKME